MQNKIILSLFFILLVSMNSKVFGAALNCKFKDSGLEQIRSIRIKGEFLIINEKMEIPLEKSLVKCGNFGIQTRLYGEAYGYQVILKTCSSNAALTGYINDSPNEASADVSCDGDLN